MQFVVDAAPLHVEVAVPCVLVHSVTVVHVNVELSPPLGGSEAVYLLQTQPMLTVELAKAFNIAVPAPVEADRSVHASLADSPSTALQVTPHIECLPTAGVYGVHTGLSASPVVDVLAAGGSGAGVCAGTWGRGGEGRGRGEATYGGIVWCGVLCKLFVLAVCGREGVSFVAVYLATV